MPNFSSLLRNMHRDATYHTQIDSSYEIYHSRNCLGAIDLQEHKLAETLEYVKKSIVCGLEMHDISK